MLKHRGVGANLRFLGRQSASDVRRAQVHTWRWLSLLSARFAVTFPAAEHHRPLAGTNLKVKGKGIA